MSKITLLSSFTRLRQLSLIAVLLVFSATAAAAPIPTSVVAFGDSLSDNGNVFALTGQPPFPYFNGRFSNGPVWVENVAASYGVGLTDYAHGGARTDANNNDPIIDLLAQGAYGFNSGLLSQVDRYLSDTGFGLTIDPTAMHTVWAGANDFLDPAAALDPIGTLTNAVTNIVTAIGTLAAFGADNFIIMGLPDLGLTPRAIADNGGVPDPSATAISGAFNDTLAIQLAANFGGVLNYEFIDTFFLLQDVVANPGSYGYTNVDTPCFDGISVCANPDEYFFWDDIHPTAYTHELVAAQVVPVPAAVWLFASALGLLGWTRRRAAA